MARIVLMGTPQFGVPILEALMRCHRVLAVVTQPDRVAGRGRSRRLASPVKLAAESSGVAVLQPARLRRNTEILRALRELGADLFVVAAFGQIIPADILAIPPHGCIGVHASLLPKLRGAAPIAAAILGGDEETGVTLMLTDAGIDTGPIIVQRRLAIAPRDTTETLSRKLSHLGAELLIETLPGWLAGEIEPRPQDDTQATYAPMIAKSDGAIDWKRTATEIDRMIRGFTPWPGAYTSYRGKTLKILRACPGFAMSARGISLRSTASATLPPQHERQVPGTVIESEGEMAVVTGDGLLLLERVQLAGKKAMDAKAFVRGQRDWVGSVLA